MTDPDETASRATIAKVLEQVPTLDAESVTIEDRGDAGSLAHVRIRGGGHEILCELNAAGDLLSARVIEL